MAKNRDWVREELLLAMNLYCRLPFGRLHKGNPEIVALASALGRTPSSVAMKLVNLASLDPAQRARGVAGLSKASRADRAIWAEFHANWEAAAVESQKLYEERVPATTRTPRRGQARVPTEAESAIRLASATEQLREVKVRIGQDFFRSAVLASYAGRCCVSGIELSELLIASHILSWSEFPQHRVDPCNGLCLSRLHDAAFDRGLVTFDAELRLILSRRLREHVTNATLHASFALFEGQALSLPDKFQPNAEFLTTHRESVFVH